MIKKAILFGLNYDECPAKMHLRGCITDVENTRTYLGTQGFSDIELYVNHQDTTKTSITRALLNAARESHESKIDLLWIHFSGHGTSIRDISGDERDGKDECLVPSDCMSAGLITDDVINSILRRFNPGTKVLCVFDCCHSGTMGDLRYMHSNNGPVSNQKNPECATNVVLLSGCMDSQTSADAFNVQNKRKYSGAMTSCLLKELEKYRDISDIRLTKLIDDLRVSLKRKGFPQYPQMTSSVPIKDDTIFFKMT